MQRGFCHDQPFATGARLCDSRIGDGGDLVSSFAVEGFLPGFTGVIWFFVEPVAFHVAGAFDDVSDADGLRAWPVVEGLHGVEEVGAVEVAAVYLGGPRHDSGLVGCRDAVVEQRCEFQHFGGGGDGVR